VTPVSIAIAAAWALISIQSVRFMRGGGVLVSGCGAIGLAALAGAAALAGLANPALVCFGAACALAALSFAPRLLSRDVAILAVGALIAACGVYAIIAGIAPLVALLCIFPLAFDAASSFIQRRLYQPDATPLYQIGLDAKLGRLSISAAYWLMSVHCGLIAIVASEVHRGAEAMSGQASPALNALTRAAIYTPQIALILLALISWKVASGLRALAEAAKQGFPKAKDES
jgi:hypothetical protein